MRTLLAVVPFCALLAACGGDAPSPPPVVAAPDTAPVRWRTVLEQDLASRSVEPRAFRATGPELRIVTTVGPNTSSLFPGTMVVNLLSDTTTLPIASVRMQVLPEDPARSDTTVVRAGPGGYALFVPQHSGYRDWRVVVQERRED